ncbi:asparagine synthetase [Streptomyces bingchenggensis BCW-1]|uniref:Asparagine synthetase n=2 Tax=Streptomyces TaxID=1883 RepID=D7C0S2_STRBB|nr:asparagine synthetase [Streptomyces bingchenggensis BCW-1]
MLMDMWWMILPDTEAAAALADRLGVRDLDLLRHASGRPWLLGRWRGAEVVTAEAGDVRVAVLGRCLLTAEALRTRIARVRDVREVADAVGRVAGSYHVVATVGGRVWARGTASAACRLFTARVEGVPVAAPGADVLAGLLDSGPDQEMLAARLMDPPLSSTALGGRTLWRQVWAVRPDEALVWERNGAQRTVRWWHPPEPGLGLRTAAEEVRAALVEAVATCTAGGGTVSADLSGGLDSTSLCFLAAARGEAGLVTLRWEGVDAQNDDAFWARRAVAALPDATHLVVTERETPDWFAGVDGMRLATEEPVAWARDVAKQSDVLERVAAHGSRLHLCGGGGDELFTPSPAHLTDLVWSHPMLVLRRLRLLRFDWRVGRTAALRAVCDRGGYQRWLYRAARDLVSPPPNPLLGRLDWQPPPRMPAWATPEAVRAVAAVLKEAADRCPEPLAPQRSLHTVLLQVREGGNAIRQMNKAFPGPGYAMPYTDDAVVAAALSVRPLEAGVPGRFKPLLTEAMDGIVPRAILRRTSKGRYGADFHRGLRRRRGEVLALLDGSLLAEAGLIDTERLRRALHTHAPASEPAFLMHTVAGEIWLRSVAQGPHPRTVQLTGGAR